MPIYEYHCNACDTVFEEWHKHADDIMEQPCPKCHKQAHRLISNTSFVLKGGGWYVTEYGNRKSDASSSGAAKDTSASPSPAAEPAAAPTPPAPAAKAEPAAASAS
ncbi:zinc ribbon domain-containing protein [Desulfovibrio sp. OttesenSCG-928-O18]|nr:zinc ribbon domain-containing protein [Desulfovibrio sp. OttesenSCG-928-O18]